MNSVGKPNGRKAIKAWNRQKILDATVEVIMLHGIAGTTIAKVVELAEVSMGMVHVHFSSKDELLREVLKQMAEDYNRHWLKVLDEAPANPAE